MLRPAIPLPLGLWIRLTALVRSAVARRMGLIPTAIGLAGDLQSLAPSARVLEVLAALGL